MKEVTLTQYLRPLGVPKTVVVDVPDDLADKSAGMVLSCEVLIGGEVVIYGRWAGSDEDDDDSEVMMMAVNGPGEKSPANVTAKVIEAVWAQPRPTSAFPVQW